MIELRLTYNEIMDTDFTAIDAEILRGQRLVARFRNYDPSTVNREIYANQSETFMLPSVKAAREFLGSNGCYHSA